MLNRKTYFIREHAGVLKLANTYDILDPETQDQIGVAKEKPGALMHVLRFMWDKEKLPTTVYVYEGSDPNDEQKLLFSIKREFSLFLPTVSELLSSIKREFSLFLPTVSVRDAAGAEVGRFKSKVFGIGISFRVLDAKGEDVASVKGDWKGWNFSFLDSSDNEIGTITKKWSGVGKELFTSADNYFIALNDEPDPAVATLLLAAGLAVDTVYMEQ